MASSRQTTSGELAARAASALPEAISGDAFELADDWMRLERLLERTIGRGFKMVFIEAASPRQRQEKLAAIRPVLARLNAVAREFDVGSWNPERRPAMNFWGAMTQAVPPQSVSPQDCLLLYGFEDVMSSGAADRGDLMRQINAQRDLLVRDFGCFWILFIHPRSRQVWKRFAPDFCDFAALWSETEPTATEITTTTPSPDHVSLRSSGPSMAEQHWPPELATANRLIELSQYDQALDKIYSFIAQYAANDPRSRDLAIARMLESQILNIRGQPAEALTRLRTEIIPVFESVGDDWSRAEAWDCVANILFARGELDEALRIRQEEQLPVYERLEDVRSRAMTLGQIADVFFQRGELDEALRIRQEEELPVYERLGDVRSRAVTLGRIADIFFQRGELDEALRIRREEQLPVYERLRDVRSRAMTLGRIADIFFQRGELDEALRILREELLPVYEQLGDVRSRAVTLGKIADIFFQRGEMDEALRIRQEEELPVYERLGDVQSLVVLKTQIAITLFQRGREADFPVAAEHLLWAYQAAAQRGLAEAKQIEAILKQLGWQNAG